MRDEERCCYLNEEVENIISQAPKENVLKLRLIQAKMNRITRTVKIL